MGYSPGKLKGCICFLMVIAFFVAIASSVPQALCQEEDRDLTEIGIEDLSKLQVYSASKLSQKVSDAPSSISIIAAEDIRRYGYRTLADVLRSINGFYISNDRNYSYIGSRGFGRPGDYNCRILILANGHRLNEIIYGGNNIGMEFPIDVDLIKEIEVVRGPGSSLYGTGAFFAVINIITKRGRDYQSAVLSSELGSQDTYQERARFGMRFKSGFEILLAGAYFDSKGYRRLYFPEYDSPATNNGIAQDADAERASNAFAAISYRDFNLQFGYSNRKKTIPTAAFGTYFNARNTHTIDRRTYLDLEFRHTYRNTWDVMGRAYYDNYNYDGIYDYDFSDTDIPFLVSNIDSADGVGWGAEAQVGRNLAGSHYLTGGFELMQSIRADQKNYDADPLPYLYLDDKRKPSSTGIFIQDEFSIRKNLILNSGLRYDHYSTFGGTTNPRLGLIYTPWDKTTFKLLYGQAFRAPSVFELFFWNKDLLPNQEVDLKPERIKTFELVFLRYFGPHWRFGSSVYYYRISQLINATILPENDATAYDNSGAIRARGWELELETKNFHGLDGRLSYAVQRAINRDDGRRLSNSPTHVVQLNLSAPVVGDKGWAGIETRYMSTRTTISGGSSGGFFTANMTFLLKNLFQNFELSASIYNLFDKRYADPGSTEHLQDTIEQDGRAFRVRLSYAIPIFATKSRI